MGSSRRGWWDLNQQIWWYSLSYSKENDCIYTCFLLTIQMAFLTISGFKDSESSTPPNSFRPGHRHDFIFWTNPPQEKDRQSWQIRPKAVNHHFSILFLGGYNKKDMFFVQDSCVTRVKGKTLSDEKAEIAVGATVIRSGTPLDG